MNFLICRLQPWMAIEVAKNLRKAGHGVHSIDHGQLEEYVESGAFDSCHQWIPVVSDGMELRAQLTQIIENYQIGVVIVTQKLFRYSNIAEIVCRGMGVRVVFSEYFFDDKLIFDEVGLQYTEKNSASGICSLPVQYPKSDREEQPPDMSRQDVIDKYKIPDGKVVVIYGQVLWDMSLLESPEGMTYDEYIDGLCRGNPDTTFLFKAHPKDAYGSPRSDRYVYRNMIRVDESLRTLFQFDAHTAYSSTVIFEGVIRGVKFATVGYHFLQRHTHRIRRAGFSDIYNKIMSVRYDMEQIKREASYITNVYTMSMSDPRLADRLINGYDAITKAQSEV